MRIIAHGWRYKGLKSPHQVNEEMTHQVKEEKLTTMAVHIQRSHVEKHKRHLFVITKAKDQITAFKQGDSGLQVHTHN